MKELMELDDSVTQAIRKDPGITRGAFLRKTSLDELQQF